MIKVNKKEFERAVKFVSKFTGKSSGLPILSMVRISEIKDQGLTLSATNLEISGSVDIPAKVESSVDSVAVDPKGLLALIKASSESEVFYHASKVDNSVSVNGIVLQGYPGDEYPETPKFEGKSFEISSEDLDGAEFAKIAVSKDPNKSTPTGVLFQDNYVIGTDGFRLYIYKTGREIKKTMLVPAGVFTKLPSSFTGPIDCKFDKDDSPNFLRIQLGDHIIITRLLQDKYPDWKQCLPKDPASSLIFKRKDLISTLKTFVNISKASHINPIVRFEDQKSDVIISLVLSSYETKKLPSVNLRCKIQRHKPENMNVAFNPNLLLDTLNELDSADVTLHLNGLLGVAAIQEVTNNHKKMAVVMPIKQATPEEIPAEEEVEQPQAEPTEVVS